MTIDWMSLLIVGVVSIAATAVFVTLLSVGIRSFANAGTDPEHGDAPRRRPVAGWLAVGLIAAQLLLALYLIIPQFH